MNLLEPSGFDVGTQEENFSDKNEVVDIMKEVVDELNLEGKASFYADSFNGRMTTSGLLFNQYMPYIAHTKIPCKPPTPVRITDTSSGKSMIAWVVDRGPFNPNDYNEPRAGYAADLSKEVYVGLTRKSRPNSSGEIAHIKIEVLDRASYPLPKDPRYASQEAYKPKALSSKILPEYVGIQTYLGDFQYRSVHDPDKLPVQVNWGGIANNNSLPGHNPYYITGGE